MAEKRGSGHQRKEEKRPAFAPSASQRELEAKVSHVPESVDSREGVGSFQSRHCERDGEGRRAPGLRPALVFRIHSEKVLRHSAGKAEFLFQGMLGDKESCLGSFVFAKRPPLRGNIHEPLRRIEPVLRSVHDQISEGKNPFQARKPRIGCESGAVFGPPVSKDHFDAAFLAEKPPMEFDPHPFCRIDQRDFIFEHGKGAPCVSNLGDRMSLRLVTKFGEAVESLGNGLGLDHAIDVSARACGGIAIELQPKRHTLKEEHPHATLPQMAFKPLAFRGLRQGVGAQGESGVAKVRPVFFCMPGRSGQGAQQESSAAVARRPKPNLPPGETRGPPWPLHPEASSPKHSRPTREGSARREVLWRGLPLRRSRNSPGN